VQLDFYFFLFATGVRHVIRSNLFLKKNKTTNLPRFCPPWLPESQGTPIKHRRKRGKPIYNLKKYSKNQNQPEHIYVSFTKIKGKKTYNMNSPDQI